MTSLLDELVGRLTSLKPEEREKAIKVAKEATKKMVWLPNPGPQTDAYLSKADILLYGGTPGGGKTGLLIGLGLTEHRRSLIVRKQFTDLEGIVDSSIAIVGNDKGFVRGNRPKYRSPDGRLVSFQGMPQNEGLDTSKQGTAYDFIGVDEAAQLTEDAVRLLIGWNRPGAGVDKSQRCRVVLASNPPVDSTGDWLGSFFAPWLDPTHPNPAKFGELRWFYFDADGKSVETQETKPFEISGKTYYPQSRTYIPARLEDNPFLDPQEYQKSLEAIPEPYRSMLVSGNFLAARKDQDFQVIPTNWVREAFNRWEANPNPPAGVPMCTMAADMVGGGADEAPIAMRYDYWFDKLVVIQGKDVPDGNLGGQIILHRKNNAFVVLDMGGGYGQATWNCLKENLGTQSLRAYKGAEAGGGRTKDKQLGFFNKRSQTIWQFREALDPSQLGGSPICLAPDPKLLSDLTTPTFEITSRGIKVESKEDVCKKLGRSSDRGDSVVMCWSEGQRGLTPLANRQQDFKRSSMPAKAVMSDRKNLILNRR